MIVSGGIAINSSWVMLGGHGSTSWVMLGGHGSSGVYRAFRLHRALPLFVFTRSFRFDRQQSATVPSWPGIPSPLR